MSYLVCGMAYSVWRERRIEWYLPSLELSSPIDLNFTHALLAHHKNVLIGGS